MKSRNRFYVVIMCVLLALTGTSCKKVEEKSGRTTEEKSPEEVMAMVTDITRMVMATFTPTKKSTLDMKN